MDVNQLISNSGITVGVLTLSVVLRGLLILVIGFALIRIVLTMFDRVCDRSEKLGALRVHIRPVLKTLLGVLLMLVVLGSLGVQVTSFIALLSVAGLAVSLALQNTLANVAGGIMLLTAQPYAVGDYVSIDGTEGAVETIGLSYCKFTTVDNKEIQIPNSQIASAKITNYNHLGRRRVDLTFSASYDAPTQAVYDALNDAMARFPQILDTPAAEVHLSGYGASSISYVTRMWVSAGDYWTVHFGMLEAVRETFAAHKVEMTYDHLNVHMVNQ